MKEYVVRLAHTLHVEAETKEEAIEEARDRLESAIQCNEPIEWTLEELQEIGGE